MSAALEKSSDIMSQNAIAHLAIIGGIEQLCKCFASAEMLTQLKASLDGLVKEAYNFEVLVTGHYWNHGCKITLYPFL